MILLANTTSTVMFAAGMALLTMLLLRRVWKYQIRSSRSKRSRRVHPGTGKSESKLESLADAPRDVLRWQVGMHETARELMGQLDSKMVALQVLIRMAQEERQKLEQTIATQSASDCLREIAELGHTAAVACSPTLVNDGPTRARILEADRAGFSPAQIAAGEGIPVGEVELFLSSHDQA